MNKILYDKITSNDNWVLVCQALIDKQAEIVEHYNAIRDWIPEVEKILDNVNEFNRILVKKLAKNSSLYKDKELVEFVGGLQKMVEK